ncbi:MarR family winged helix-turn-helix transcriptional regulator [Microlunatus sp. GCM10028923]|uniref:MarR family winged helix-turn-helix transcriptional regulator n=1 Tax=Microlunatus sp. GCM10028923 TaxID=3273400 RepID=UPI00360F0D5D
MVDQPHVGVLMFVASRAVETRVIEAVQAAGYSDLTVAQGRIAARIGPHGTRLSELAEQAQVAKQTATALVDRLEAAGYVERVVDPSDARARLVRISRKGRKVVAIARRVEAEIDAEWTRHLGSRRMAQLKATLAELRPIVDPYQ